MCWVDELRLKGLLLYVAVAPGSVAYLRFHGRKAVKWYNHDQVWEHHSYTYPVAELPEWAS